MLRVNKQDRDGVRKIPYIRITWDSSVSFFLFLRFILARSIRFNQKREFYQIARKII